MAKKKVPKRIYKEGVFFYVGRPDEFRRSRTGAGLKGLMRAIKSGAKC